MQSSSAVTLRNARIRAEARRAYRELLDPEGGAVVAAPGSAPDAETSPDSRGSRA